MTDERRGEDGFFEGAPAPGARAPEPAPPRRRTMAALLARNPVFAVIALLFCGIAPGQVNVKATTGEGMGFVGREEGIAAHAVALLVRRAP